MHQDQQQYISKRSAHLLFRTKLAASLMKYSRSRTHTIPKEAIRTRTSLDNHVQLGPEGCQRSLIYLSKISKKCKICQTSSRSALGTKNRKRKTLEKLFCNSVSQIGAIRTRRERPKRTRYGCSTCNIPLCQYSVCWHEHISRTIN